jgi:hypothetical protein
MTRVVSDNSNRVRRPNPETQRICDMIFSAFKVSVNCNYVSIHGHPARDVEDLDAIFIQVNNDSTPRAPVYIDLTIRFGLHRLSIISNTEQDPRKSVIHSGLVK